MAIADVEHRPAATSDDANSDYENVRHLVDSLPAPERARLAQHIITTLMPDEVRGPKKRNSVGEIFGRMAVEGVPAPSDEEVARMIEDYRTEKYG